VPDFLNEKGVDMMKIIKQGSFHEGIFENWEIDFEGNGCIDILGGRTHVVTCHFWNVNSSGLNVDLKTGNKELEVEKTMAKSKKSASKRKGAEVKK
jgi:subtilisin-like proprotein convertase family protein